MQPPLFVAATRILFAAGVHAPPGARYALLALLAVLAAVHAAWAAGVTWPARDRAQLARYVISTERLPGPGACAAVALGLAGFAWLFVADAPRATWRGVGQLLVVAVFAVRGALGLFFERARPSLRGTPFGTYNRWVYSPLCLLIAALAACSLR